jgi:hypothetical protein
VLQVVINDRVVKSLALINSGRVNFDFIWELGSNASLSVKPQAGSVPKGERRVVEVSYAPTTQDQLAGYPISCQVRRHSAACKFRCAAAVLLRSGSLQRCGAHGRHSPFMPGAACAAAHCTVELVNTLLTGALILLTAFTACAGHQRPQVPVGAQRLRL